MAAVAIGRTATLSCNLAPLLRQKWTTQMRYASQSACERLARSPHISDALAGERVCIASVQVLPAVHARMLWDLHSGGSTEVLSALMNRIENEGIRNSGLRAEQVKQDARRRSKVAMGLGMTPTRAKSPPLSRGAAAVIVE